MALPVRATGRRCGGALVILLATASWFVPAALGQSDEVFYLRDQGVPSSHLSSNVPLGSLGNPDSTRNADPGLTLVPTAVSASVSNPERHQQWVYSGGALSIDGTVALTITAAMSGFDSEQAGELRAYLLDCNAGLSACTTITSASRYADPWSPSGQWTTRTITFGTVAVDLAASRRLVVKVMVDASGSDGDMWLAYGSSAYQSRLVIEASSTTTTGATTTTATSNGATTTTVAAITTSTTTQPVASPAADPTTTTAPATEAVDVEQTAEATAAGDPPSTQQPKAGELVAVVRAEDGRQFVRTVGSDFALSGMLETPKSESATSGFLRAVELVLPESVAAFVLSPFIVFTAIGRALVSTGSVASLHAASMGVALGLYLVFSERRRQAAR